MINGISCGSFTRIVSSPSVRQDGKANNAKETFIGKKGEKLVEGSAQWQKFAQRVANGEQTKDGTPLPVMMAEYYSIPNEAMTRFLALVTNIQTT